MNQPKIYEEHGNLFYMNYTDIKDKLESGNYILRVTDKGVFYLQRAEEFKIPSKVYGNLIESADRYIKAFNAIPGNMGILLNGEKGSGKTLLSAIICDKLDLPVIRIENRFIGPGFLHFVTNINQACVILIDEFDKIYPEWDEDEDGNRVNTQTELLKLLDGGMKQRKLFIFTSNESTLSQYMINRPSRIRYKQSFGKLDEVTMKEVLEDRLDNKEYIPEVLDLALVYFGFNLDTLLVLIEEVNLWKDSPKKVIQYMNIEPEADEFDAVLVEPDGKVYQQSKSVRFKPSTASQMPYMTFWTTVDESNPKAKQVRTINYESLNAFKVEASKEGLRYTHAKHNYTLIFKKAIPFKTTYLV